MYQDLQKAVKTSLSFPVQLPLLVTPLLSSCPCQLLFHSLYSCPYWLSPCSPAALAIIYLATLSTESAPICRLAGFQGIPRKRSAICRRHKFPERAEHNIHGHQPDYITLCEGKNDTGADMYLYVCIAPV